MTDLFDDHKDNSEELPNPSGDPADTLAQLVGEGRKFKTVEDLAKSKLESDKFIEQLKTEGAEMREQLKTLEAAQGKARTIEDVLNAVKGVRDEDGNQSAVSTEDILKAIDQRVSELDRTKQRRANAEVAQAELLKRFNGDETKAREFIRTEAQRVGLTPQELKGLSETSPEAFKRILGLTKPTNGSGPSFVSEVNSDSSSGKMGTRNKAYYDELKKTLGAKFYEPAIQQQRMKDATALGSKFYE